MARFPGTGKLEWIGVRPSRGADVESRAEAVLEANRGIEGDHRYSRPGSKRQITLIQWEHLNAVAGFCGVDRVDPAWLRRNLAVSAINLNALKNRRFRIGDVVLEGTGPCHPCSRMEHILGAGGYNALRGHGGITAKVIESGVIRVGDRVSAAEAESVQE